MSERRWTLEAARALLPDVRARTARAVAEAEALAEQQALHAADSAAHRELAERIEAVGDALGPGDGGARRSR